LKFIAFKWRGFERLGWLLDDEETVLGVERETIGMPQTVMDVIKRGPYARHQLKKAEETLERLNINDLEMLPPITPGTIFSVDSNITDSAPEEDGLGFTVYPTTQIRLARNHVPHGQVIDVPKLSKTLSCEGKLAIVIGRGGRYISPLHAMKHVFGYSIYNEGSVKGFEKHASLPGLGKFFDLSASFGPAITTEDEVGDPYQQTIETRVDGKAVNSGPLSSMLHRIEDVIVYISSAIELFPGDIICMGIPTAEERYLKKGELVEITISAVGTLANEIKDEPTEPKTMGCC
jgi:2-keto-4-pentenoate hydratase/2-oxohepta-3-ene-1,7-dioic acid hydratase in catechol pathway